MSALSLFTERTRDWFAREIGSPTPVQAEGWPAIASGRDVLVSAPTGTGKTLTAFLFFLDRLAREAESAPLPDGVRVLYVSPLKALGNDIRANLRRPLAGLGLEALVRAEVRTGDTPARDRARMAKHPPQILITTPESLYLLLTSQSGRGMLRGVEAVILDELHAVLSSKRGAHLAVSLARLDALCGRKVQRVGLSATVRPLETAAAFLTGPMRPAAAIVAPRTEKALDIRVELPAPSFALLPEKSVWPAIAERAVRESAAARTTLVFVDGRAQAEKLAHHINLAAGHEQYARTHHGCVSREQRHEAEQQLREGTLRALVCTSSMELGIDVGEIDLVLQIGAPAQVSSLLQRAGRAGHGPDRVSRMIIYPRTEAEALSCGLAARAALAGEIERPRVPEMCLDVLAQHLVSMAAAGEYTLDEALALLRETYPFRGLDRARLESVLAMLSGDYEHERELPVRPRILWDRRAGRVSGDSYTRMLACSSGGTIPDRGWFAVTLPDGTRLGELDEEFVFEARQGDKFLLGAFAWRIREFTRESVIVEQASPEGAQSPFWRGDAAGRSPETGRFFGRLLRELDEAAAAGRLEAELALYPLSPEAREAAARHIVRQREAIGCLATDETLVAEHFADEAGDKQLMLHCPMGRRVNRALGMLLRAEARRRTGLDVRSYEDDDGVLLWAMGGADLPVGLVPSLPGENLEAVLRAMLPGEPVFSMAFRYAAGRALMLGMRRGSRQPLWVQRLRGAESLGAAIARRDHPLLWEAERETLTDWMDLATLARLLGDVRAGRVRLWETRSDVPSPMALPLRRQVEAEMMYEYSPIPSAAVRLAEDESERARLVVPDESELSEAARGAVARDRAHLMRILVAEGDLAPGDAAAEPEWLEELTASGEVLWIAPGLWIARDEEALYARALDSAAPDRAALERIVRRAIRFRGPQSGASLAERYDLPEAVFSAILAGLEKGGLAVALDNGEYVHRDLYSAAQAAAVRSRRRAVATAPGERFAALLAQSVQTAGPATEQLRAALKSLCGQEKPAALWEEILLPARVGGYRPALLDALLAGGEFFWRLRLEDGKPLVTFFPIADDGDAFTPAEPALLTDDERAILGALEAGGAQFEQRIGARLGGVPVHEALLRLAALGLVRKDSFGPVRALLAKAPAKRRRPSVRAQDTGRWERARIPREAPLEERIARAFRRCPVLCRETAFGLDWGEALSELRRWEYSARARRGYFVAGLSGAQFVLAEDFPRVSAFLAAPDDRAVCLSAVDPALAWGRILPHMPGWEFALLPQTAVVLIGGRPAALWERGGACLRLFDGAEAAVSAFAEAFRAGRVFAAKRRVVCKEYPAEAAPLLARAGFVREMLDYVLER